MGHPEVKWPMVSSSSLLLLLLLLNISALNINDARSIVEAVWII
jgi:hypothetical protein